MKILVTGATGFVGKHLVRALVSRGDVVWAVSRDPESSRAALGDDVRTVDWAPERLAPVMSQVQGVVHLAGESIFGRRWSPTVKEEIRRSRLEGARTLVEAMRTASSKPEAFLIASAVGYYGFRGDEPLDESAAPGSDFLASVCREHEAEAFRGESLGVRTVFLRIGVVLGPDGGALQQMLGPFRMFVGGPVGSGRQWFSWIHLDDLVGAILFCLDRGEIRGPLNATSPGPQTNRDFSKTLGRVLHRPAVFKAPGFALRLAFGEVADILIRGQRVLPRKLEASGYAFAYPTAEAALRQILSR